VVTALVSTVNLAAIYALVAVGVSLTWSGLSVLNLGHGMTFAVAGYGAWWTSEHISASAPAVVLGGLVAGAAVGMLIWVVVFLFLDGRPGFAFRSLIATLALSLIGTNVLLEVFGANLRALPQIFGDNTFIVAGTAVTSDKTGAVTCAAIVLSLLVVSLKRSRLGLAVRALSQNPDGAALVGINRSAVALAIFMVSGALAGLAGVLLAPTFFVSPTSGLLPLIEGLIVALLGGLGSVGGAVVAAVLMGATAGFTGVYVGGQYVLMMQFALIAIVLLVRPRGLAGILETARA
jgi:branched-chain amino acid transport system permease protein